MGRKRTSDGERMDKGGRKWQIQIVICVRKCHNETYFDINLKKIDKTLNLLMVRKQKKKRGSESHTTL